MSTIDLLNLKLEEEKGFSLAELVIVLGILTMSLLGIISLVFQNMQVENLTKGYLTASMLAQEGVELVRNVRDENWVNYKDWLLHIDPGTFAIDYRGWTSVNQVPSVNGDAGTRLYLDGNGFYTHLVSPRGTVFNRLITIQDFDDYVLVSSDVMWQANFGIQHYVIDTALYDWR